ncbi:DNA modification methylase [Candidatus Zixiibacteriota bacterium]
MLKVETISIGDIKPNPDNPRINDPAVDAVVRSIQAYGFNNPLITDADLNIAAGHTRLKAAKKLGLGTVPVIRVPGLIGSKFTGYAIADNQTASIADWNDELLAKVVSELNLDVDFDLASLGFDDRELTRILDSGIDEIDDQADEVPPVPEEPLTRAGDLWVLGNHRLLCGDCRDAAALDRLMAGERAAMYATDPPYGVGYDGTNHPQNRIDKKKGLPDGHQNKDWSAEYWDHFSGSEEFETFLTAAFNNAKRYLVENAAWYTWHASATAESFRRAWEQVGIRYHQTVVWIKPTFVLGYSLWNWRYEPCLIGWQQGHKPLVNTIREENSNVWEIDWEGKARNVDSVHPTQKPVRLFELPLLKHTRRGDICLESFSGSGSQIIAAEKLGRRCFALELEPRFCDVAVARWESYTGEKANLIRESQPMVATANPTESSDDAG